MALDPAHEARIEHWLVRRGIPHFIEQYSASRDVLTRAIPFLAFVFLVEMFSAGKLGWSWWANRTAEIGALGVLIAIWALANRLRGRPTFARPERVGWVEVVVFVFGPAIVPVLFGGELDDAGLTIVVNIAVLAGAYAVTSYGIVPMMRWALVRMVVQIGDTLRLFTRGLPLLLVAFTFLFINAEVWQVGASLDAWFMTATLLLFGLVGLLFVVTRLPDELKPLAVFADGEEIADLVADTPAGGLPGPAPGDVPPPNRRQWVNAALVMVFVQGMRIVTASVLLGGFFVLFGLLTMQPATIESWTTSPVEVLATFEVGGRTITVTAELLAVAGFLAGFSGMYFAVYLVTDPTFRTEFFDDVRHELREAFAVRAVYARARR